MNTAETIRNEFDTLAHYGVLGMKWGVHKATRKSERNAKLTSKALKYDKKAASQYLKAEKRHSEYDLEGANKAAIKSATYSKKAAKAKVKALKAADEYKRTKLERKASKFEYKAAVKGIEDNAISRTKGYGYDADKAARKGDKFTVKAARARKNIANNNYYIERMKRKASQIPSEELDNGYAFVREFLDNI